MIENNDLETSLIKLQSAFIERVKMMFPVYQNELVEQKTFQAESGSQNPKNVSPLHDNLHRMEVESPIKQQPPLYDIWNPQTAVLDFSEAASLQYRLDKINVNFVTQADVTMRFMRHKENQKKMLEKRMSDLSGFLSQQIEIPSNFNELVFNNDRLTKSDLENMKPPRYLNGEGIYFYLKLVIQNIVDQQIKNQTFVYNTYFMTKLLGEYITNQKKLDSIKDTTPRDLVRLIRTNGGKLLRWTKGINIFEKRILIIPINLPMHWISIIVLNLPSLVGDGKAQPCILYMDSMGKKNKSLIEAIRIYIQIELENKLMYQAQNHHQINSHNLPDYQLLVPRQVNFYDCGPCALLNVQSLLLNPFYLNKDFSQVSVRKQFLNIYPKSLILTMRQRMMSLFIKLFSASQNPELQKVYIQQFIEQKQQLINERDPFDFDTIDAKEFKKFLAIKKYDVQNQQQQYQKLLEFYLDPQFNYFQMK